jgi:hypothetical protein
VPATVAFTIQDGKNPPKTSTVFVNIPVVTTAANGITFAQSLAVLLDALIGGKISQISLCYSVSLPGGLKASPNVNADVEEGGKFIFKTVNNHPTSLRLPTFLESLILSGTKSIDLTDLGVDAFVDAMAAGLSGVSPTDSRDEDVTSLTSGRENFVKDRG